MPPGEAGVLDNSRIPHVDLGAGGVGEGLVGAYIWGVLGVEKEPQRKKLGSQAGGFSLTALIFINSASAMAVPWQ